MKSVLIITRWFPTKNEPTRCVFVENILNQHAQYSSKYIFNIIIPIPYYIKLMHKNFNSKYYNFARHPIKENRKTYKI